MSPIKKMIVVFLLTFIALTQINTGNPFDSGFDTPNSFNSLGNSETECQQCYLDWMRRYGNSYGFNSQDQFRRNVFMENYRKVQAHNQRTDVKYKMKVTKFSGLTKQ